MFDTKTFKQSILNEAVQGKLTKQLPEDGDANDLLQLIKKEKQRLIRAGKIKKQKKLSPVRDDEIPFNIPNNWKWVRLYNIGLIISGGTPRKNKAEYWNDKYLPWITPKLLGFNQSHKLLHDTNQYISAKGLKESSAQFIEKGSIAFSSRAPIGHINIVDFDYSTNQGAKSITPLKINRDYLYYSLKERTDAIRKQGSGTTFKEVSKTALSNSLIPVPPLSEQKRIVQKIDKCFKWADLINQEQKLTQDFDDDMHKSLLQSAMQGKLTQQSSHDGDASDLLQSIDEEKQRLIKSGKIKQQKKLSPVRDDENPFSIPDNWQWARLGYFSRLENGDRGKNYPGKKYWINNGVPFINAGALSDEGFIDKNNLNYISDDRFNLLRSGLVDEGDILYTLRGSVGRIGLNTNISKGAIASSLTIIKSLGIDSYFLRYVLLSPLNITFLRQNMNGTAQPNLSAKKLSDFIVPIPPLAEQKRIVNKLDSMFEHINNM